MHRKFVFMLDKQYISKVFLIKLFLNSVTQRKPSLPFQSVTVLGILLITFFCMYYLLDRCNGLMVCHQAWQPGSLLENSRCRWRKTNLAGFLLTTSWIMIYVHFYIYMHARRQKDSQTDTHPVNKQTNKWCNKVIKW